METNDMNDEFVEELLAQCVKLQRMGAANHEILAVLRQFESRVGDEG